MSGRLKLFTLLGAIALSGIAASNAAAADNVEASPVCCTFTTGAFFQDQGEIPDFINPADSDAPHNVTSEGSGPDKGPIFESQTIFGGASSPINGAQYLGAGSYPFVCTIHTGMSGDLVVEDKGTPAARPSLRLSIPSQSLKKIKKSGKVKVKVKASSQSNGVRVGLLKGKKKVSKQSKLNLSAGKSKTVPIKLNGAGRKAVKKVKKGKKLKLSASLTVPFGKPAKVNKSLR